MPENTDWNENPGFIAELRARELDVVTVTKVWEEPEFTEIHYINSGEEPKYKLFRFPLSDITDGIT